MPSGASISDGLGVRPGEKLLEVAFGCDFVITELVVSIDPSDSSTGIGLWSVAPKSAPIGAFIEKIDRAGYRQEDAIDKLDRKIGTAKWMVALEHAPPLKKGLGNAPTHAEQYWLDALDLLARRRCERAGERFRKPTILRPEPAKWRSETGLPTHGPSGDRLADREWLKQKAIERLKRIHNLDVPQPDMSDALNIADWAVRTVLFRARLIPPAGTKKKNEVRFAA
jgi:hypothetical protein